jgi:hypothetical protein
MLNSVAYRIKKEYPYERHENIISLFLLVSGKKYHMKGMKT